MCLWKQFLQPQCQIFLYLSQSSFLVTTFEREHGSFSVSGGCWHTTTPSGLDLRLLAVSDPMLRITKWEMLTQALTHTCEEHFMRSKVHHIRIRSTDSLWLSDRSVSVSLVVSEDSHMTWGKITSHDVSPNYPSLYPTSLMPVVGWVGEPTTWSYWCHISPTVLKKSW